MSRSSRPTPASTPPSTPGSPAPTPLAPEPGDERAFDDPIGRVRPDAAAAPAAESAVARILARRGSVAREAARKSLHVATAIGGALLVAFASPIAARATFVAAAALAIGIDLVRLRRPRLHRRFEAALAPMLRAREDARLTGATTLAVGFAVAVLIFPRAPATAGLLYAGLADAAGAVVGRAFGHHPIRSGRTAEGSSAVFAVALVIGLALGLGPMPAAGVAAALTALELLPLPFDDNLVLPPAAALAFLLVAVPA